MILHVKKCITNIYLYHRLKDSIYQDQLIQEHFTSNLARKNLEVLAIMRLLLKQKKFRLILFPLM